MKISTDINKKTSKSPLIYKHFSMIKTIKKSELQPNIQSVEQVNATIDIINYKIISPIINNYTLLIDCVVNFKVIYIPSDLNESMYTIYSKQYFLEYIDIPEVIAKSCSLKINPSILNIEFCLLDSESICVGISYLLEVLSCSCKKSNKPCSSVNYIGISNIPLIDSLYHKYFIIDNKIEITSMKPTIEDLLSIKVDVHIVDYTINKIERDFGIIENHLDITLKVDDNIIFVGNLPTQPVHGCNYVTCIPNVDIIIPSNVDTNNINIKTYVKYIWATLASDRLISRHIFLLINFE